MRSLHPRQLALLSAPPLHRTSTQHRRPSSRRLHLAPPFLVDEPYLPRLTQLSAAAEARKRAEAEAHLRACNLCPRLCNVDRYATTGFCLVPAARIPVATIAPHFGEEACLHGTRGSGSVFFSGCSLRCVFCQNYDVAHRRVGPELTPSALADWFIRLQDEGGVHNINLVTPEHVVPQVALALLDARHRGLRLPIVYNTSAYESAASLALMDGLVDIYLPDFKVWDDRTARRLLKADGYAAVARESIRAMHEQVGDLCFAMDGLAKRGVLVRHLVMPGGVEEGKSIMQWLASEEGPGRDVYVHIMEQYAPRAHVGQPKRGRARAASSAGGSGGGGGDAATDGTSTATAAAEAAPSEVRYADINRPIESEELRAVREAAKAAGLWRFEEAPKHGGWVS